MLFLSGKIVRKKIVNFKLLRQNTMTYIEQHLIETYTDLFKGLSTVNKIGLFESLSKLIETENDTVDGKFYSSFGAFSSQQSAEEIINDIKINRNFRDKKIEF